MDFKHKGITWVGNMYQKFEAVCQEVDNIISQDTVKYVENQVNSASESVKKFYSDVVQDLLPPIVDPVKYEAQAVAQRGSDAVNAYFKSLTSTEENVACSVSSKSSVGLGVNDLMDNQLSRASCKITSLNEEGSQVSNHSLLELNAKLHLGKNDDVLIDKDLDESIKEKAINELLSGKSDGKLTDKHVFMDPDAGYPLKNPIRNASSKIDFTTKRATLVCDDSDLQLEDEALLGKNDGALTDKDTNEKDATMELDASDPLKQGPNHASSQVKFTNEKAISVFDDSHLPLESSILPRKNDDALTDEDSDESSKKDVIMEPDSGDHSKSHSSHTCSATNFISKEASLVSNDLLLLLQSEVLLGKNDMDLDKSPIKDGIFEPEASGYFSKLPSDDSLLLVEAEVLSGKNDRDLDKSPIKDGMFEPEASRYFSKLCSDSCSKISFTNREAFVVSDSSQLQLESELLSGKNSIESLINETIMQNDVSHPLKNQARCTLGSITYENEEVTSVSNYSLPQLESELFVEKNGETSMDREADASFKAQAKLEFSTELIPDCDNESIKGSLYSEFCENECEEGLVTLTGDLPETSIRSADIGSTRKVGQASSILANSLLNFPPKMEITAEYFANETSYSSYAKDPISSELDPLVLTCGKEELRPICSLKSLSKESVFASKNSVGNFLSSTVVRDKSQCVSDNFETHPSFDVVTSASCENKALEIRLASSGSSSLSMQPPAENHALRSHGSAFLSEFCTSSHIQFSESTGSEALIFSEVGCSYNSSGSIPDDDMETVDLRDKVTPKDSYDIVDYRTLHAVSRRTQKLCSYKKRIQDAFTTQRRLAKEYEQLAIWYGDTDLEFSTDSSQKLPCFAQTPLDSKNVSTSYASDSEWEIL